MFDLLRLLSINDTKWGSLSGMPRQKQSQENYPTRSQFLFLTASYYPLTMEIMKEEHANSFIALERFDLSNIEICELHKTFFC